MRKKRIMVAGVGNIFLKDDGFAAEVIKRLATQPPRGGVEVRDFGTGGLKLAYDLMQGYDALILVDASPRGGAPGTLYVIEPEVDKVPMDLTQGGPIDPHWTDTQSVLRFVKSLGGLPQKVLLIGCEPAAVAEMEIGLSGPVLAAVDQAVKLVESTLEDLQREEEVQAYERIGHAA